MNAQVIIVVLSILLSSLATYFVTSVSRRGNVNQKQMTEFVDRQVLTHVNIAHKHDLVSYVDESLREHKTECQIVDVARKLERIDKILIYLVLKLGGDVKELEL